MAATLKDLHYLGTTSPVIEAPAAPEGDPPPGQNEYWAGRRASQAQLEAWADAFYRDGCLLIENVLPPPTVQRLRDDILTVLGDDGPEAGLALRDELVAILLNGPDDSLELRKAIVQIIVSAEEEYSGASTWIQPVIGRVIVAPPEMLSAARAEAITALGQLPPPEPGMRLTRKMFAQSAEHLNLFDLEPIVSLAELMLGKDCHVIFSTAFRTTGGESIDFWHQDDPPHLLVMDGEAPSNIQLPPLAFACNYYLTDITPEEGDGTHTVPGSHLFGAAPPRSLEGTKWASLVRSNTAPAGSVHLHNCQTWHRGGPNPGRPRYMTSVHYARRFVGHKYYPFMNYQLPEHVLVGADDRRRRLLGFLPHGAYE